MLIPNIDRIEQTYIKYYLLIIIFSIFNIDLFHTELILFAEFWFIKMITNSLLKIKSIYFLIWFNIIKKKNGV